MLKKERSRTTNANKNGGQFFSERPLSDQGDQSGRRDVGRRDVSRGVVHRHPTSSRGASSDGNAPTASEVIKTRGICLVSSSGKLHCNGNRQGIFC